MSSKKTPAKAKDAKPAKKASKASKPTSKPKAQAKPSEVKEDLTLEKAFEELHMGMGEHKGLGVAALTALIESVIKPKQRRVNEELIPHLMTNPIFNKYSHEITKSNEIFQLCCEIHSFKADVSPFSNHVRSQKVIELCRKKLR